MKTEMFEPVLAWLDAGGDNGQLRFNMNYTLQDDGCGTVCCIAGALQQFNGLAVHHNIWFCAEVGELVGMTDTQVQNLFWAENRYRHGSHGSLSEIEPHEAAAAIRSMLETGEVTWA